MADQQDTGDDGLQRDGVMRWVEWLDGFIAGLADLPGETASDFCEAAMSEWHVALNDRPPRPDTASMVLLLEVLRSLTQVMAASMDERVSRSAAEASVAAALKGVRNDAGSWLHGGPPDAEEIKRRVASVGTAMKLAQDTFANRIAEDDADDAYAAAHPYGAILGYRDEKMDADIIFTQVCEFTDEEHQRYSDAYGRLKELVDQDLFSYVSDASDAFLDVVCKVLRDIQNQAFSLSNSVEAHKRVRRIRSALIAFTSSVQIHQDQTYYKIKHKFGKESDEHKAVRRLFHSIYADNFGYRWLIELRHVMLHLNMDAFTIALTARLDGEPTIELGMSRHWMSRSSGVMDKAYKRDELNAMTSDPGVLDMINVLQPAFGPLQDELDSIMFPAADVAKDAETVRELIRRFNGREGMYCLQNGPGFTRRLRTPPFSQLDPRVLSFADSYGAS